MVVRVVRKYRDRSAFSLIELLVSLAIISLLIAIMLPAVVSMREASRRVTCCNHLRQIGLALHLYDETHGTLPIGARAQRGIGPSWMVGLLPYIEQGALFQQFDMDSPNNGWPAGPPVPLGSRNGAVLNGRTVSMFWCSSSPVPMMQPSGTLSFQLAAYVGIAGATNDDSFPARRVNVCCSTGGNNGQVSADGMLFPNGTIRMTDVKDGLANTMIVGEASNYSWDAARVKKRTDGSYNLGWAAGTNGTGTPPAYTGSSPLAPPPPIYNITTIRHSPNSGYSQPGVFENHGPNNPLSSAHPGGVGILMSDGAVRFLSENVALVTLKSLAVRDDGSPLGEF